jgi:hypothetical protein
MATKPKSSVNLLTNSPEDWNETERQLTCAVLLARADKLPKGNLLKMRLLLAAKQLLDYPKGTDGR